MKTATPTRNAPPLTPLEFDRADFALAHRMARKMGFRDSTAYTTSSDMWGLFCLRENPAHYPAAPRFNGCIIKTAEFGLMFVATADDMGIAD